MTCELTQSMKQTKRIKRYQLFYEANTIRVINKKNNLEKKCIIPSS